MITIAQGRFSKPRGPASPAQPPKAPVNTSGRSPTPGTNAPRNNGSVNHTAAPGAPGSYAQKASAPKDSASRKKTKKILLISICSVAAVALIGAIISVWLFWGWPTDDGLILNNVTVAGINLGGMTQEEAETALHQITDQTYTQVDMVIELPDVTLNLTPAETGAKLDVEAAIAAAYDYGRKGTYEEREKAKTDSETNIHHIALLPYLNLNTDIIRSTLDDYGAQFNSTYAPSSVTVDGETPILDASDENFDPAASGQTLTLNMGSPGRYVDIEDVYNDVLDAYSFNNFLVTVQMEEEETIPEELDLEALYEQYCSEPVDAVMDSETYEVIYETYGYGFNLEDAQLLLEQAQYGDTIELKLELIAPEILGADMAAKLFRDVLGEYKTEHTKDANRNTNLELACKAINGTVLDPGEVFDYNVVVGKRTAEAGYKAADAYSGGQTVKTLGGGICQVSSTIYYCTLVADLEIVDRSPHSYVSSYMPMGMDATVSWGGPEFRFKNSTNYPIRIETWVADGYVHAKLIGTDEKDYYIEMEYETIGSEGYETIYQEISSDNNPEGYKDGETITSAYRGYTVNTYKNKYDKETGELISRDFDRLSKYKKRDKVVAKIVEPTEPPTEAPTAPPETAPPETTPPATEAPAPEQPAEDNSGAEE